jgi:CRP/FNR family transcriptional regulator
MTVFHSHRNSEAGIEGTPLAGRFSITHGASPAARRLARGTTLYGFGDPCRALYAVQQGTLKSVAVSDDGLTQVTGFPMTGDIVGLDGIDTGAHQNEAIALEDCELAVLPLAPSASLSPEADDTRRMILRAIAGELVRCQRLVVMLGTMRAEQRVALFLVELAGRHAHLGGSRMQFALQMQRRDIASYLGLKIETVSRAFSHLQHEGIIAVDGKSIRVLDAKALEAVSGVVARVVPSDADRRAN